MIKQFLAPLLLAVGLPATLLLAVALLTATPADAQQLQKGASVEDVIAAVKEVDKKNGITDDKFTVIEQTNIVAEVVGALEALTGAPVPIEVQTILVSYSATEGVAYLGIFGAEGFFGALPIPVEFYEAIIKTADSV